MPSVASSVNTLGSNNDSQAAKRTLTDVSSITTMLTSAVSGMADAASNGDVGDIVGGVVSGVTETVSSIASAIGRRLLRDSSSISISASGLASRNRQLLQTMVSYPFQVFACCSHHCMLCTLCKVCILMHYVA